MQTAAPAQLAPARLSLRDRRNTEIRIAQLATERAHEANPAARAELTRTIEVLKARLARG